MHSPCLKPRLAPYGSKRFFPIRTALLVFSRVNLHSHISCTGMAKSQLLWTSATRLPPCFLYEMLRELPLLFVEFFEHYRYWPTSQDLHAPAFQSSSFFDRTCFLLSSSALAAYPTPHVCLCNSKDSLHTFHCSSSFLNVVTFYLALLKTVPQFPYTELLMSSLRKQLCEWS